jgi:hypothetical protein
LDGEGRPIEVEELPIFLGRKLIRNFVLNGHVDVGWSGEREHFVSVEQHSIRPNNISFDHFVVPIVVSSIVVVWATALQVVLDNDGTYNNRDYKVVKADIVGSNGMLFDAYKVFPFATPANVYMAI